MEKLKLAVSDFADGIKSRLFTVQEEEAPDQMHREIKGSFWSLITLFSLIALTSYIPIDSFNLFNGHIDHMNNLGGVVGAAIGEWFLGTVGIFGYTIILATCYMTFLAFRGRTFRQNTPKFIGLLFFAVLGAITCQLIWGETSPEASLLQGGVVGKFIGNLLLKYFNTGGALVIVSGGFLVTLILTTGLSILYFIKRLFNGDDFEEDLDEEEEIEEEKPIKKTATKKAAAPAPAKAKRKPRKNKAAEEGDDIAQQATEEGTEITGEDTEEESQENKTYEFQDFTPFAGSYSLPSTRLLKNAPSVKSLSKGDIKKNAAKLIEHLLSFQITGDVTDATQGPFLTTYEFKPSAGMKLSKIAALEDDLGIVMGTRELRIIAPIPGKTVVGIEVPRPQLETISLKEVFGEKEFADKKNRLPVALGKTTDGSPKFADLASMPHLLVAGGTGSGKSVFVNSLIMSLIYRCTPQQMRMILVDPKMLELNVFDGLPHLLTNVITDNKIAFNALSWAVWEMDRRYGLMAKTGSKNIESYNEKQKSSAEKLPFIVIIVDELADLMMSGGEMVETAITRLAQKARAAGLHLVLATQRPSTDVVTGLIKANMPSRISFKVPSGIDSRTVLDTGGAEMLMGRGDCLMIQPGIPLRRLHATFVTEDELKRTVKYCTGGKDHSDIYMDFSGKNPNSDD